MEKSPLSVFSSPRKGGGTNARGGGGGVGLLPGYVLDRSLLTDGEQDEILYALRAMAAAGMGGAALEKLAGLFQKSGDGWLEVDFSPWGSGPA